MTLLQGGVHTFVIAVWLGYAGIRSTDPYLHGDITIKERALALTTPTAADQPTRHSRSSKSVTTPTTESPKPALRPTTQNTSA
jgi:hypothetical protein